MVLNGNTAWHARLEDMHLELGLPSSIAVQYGCPELVYVKFILISGKAGMIESLEKNYGFMRRDFGTLPIQVGAELGFCECYSHT